MRTIKQSTFEWEPKIRIDELTINQSKLNDLKAIQRKVEWARDIRARKHKEWSILAEELKLLGSVWMKVQRKQEIGRILTCSTDTYGGGLGISINWIDRDENGIILTTPNKNLPLLIGSLTPEGEKILEKRLRGEIKEVPHRPDLINRYQTIEAHLMRAGRFIGVCRQIIITYIYNKYGDTMYGNKYSDTTVKLTISGKEYIYIHKNGTSYNRNNLITPEDSIIKETI
jgi:hypothetical protein